MELNITEFRKRLDDEIAHGLKEAEITDFIHKEIRLTEIMKASMLEEMNDNTKDFLSDTAARIDTYLFQLQELELKLRLHNLPLDQKVAINDTEMRDSIADEMEKLHEMDPEKFPAKEMPEEPDKK